jgi:hypothetical protein
LLLWVVFIVDAKEGIEIEPSNHPPSPSKYLCEHVPMPQKSHFAGLEAPNDAAKWENAIEDACAGRLVLLDRALRVVGKRPDDIYRGLKRHMLTHDMGDRHVSNGMKIGAAVESYYKEKEHSEAAAGTGTGGGKGRVRGGSGSGRAPIIHLGHRTGKHSRSFNEFDVKHLCEFRDELPGKLVAIGCMDSNWGYLSTNILNRYARGPYPALLCLLLPPPIAFLVPPNSRMR